MKKHQFSPSYAKDARPKGDWSRNRERSSFKIWKELNICVELVTNL